MPTRTPTTPAEAYQEFYGPAIFDPLATRLLRHARPAPGEAVVDVACGTGIVTRRAAAAVGDGGRVVGVDVNPAMLDVARTRELPGGASLEWIEGEASDLALPDATFDLLLCQQGLQFFPDRVAAAAEMRRVVRDTGRATIAVWQGLDRHPLFAALAKAEVPHLTRAGLPVTYADAVAPFSFGDAAALERLLLDAGFSDVEVAATSIEARFPDAARFVEQLEYAYAAVVPAFAEDPAAFAAYLAAIEDETRHLVDRYRHGDEVVVPMHANVAVAHAGAG